VVDASNTFVLLLDAPVRELRGVATSNPEYREQFRTVRIQLDEPSIAARAVRARSPQVVPDVSAASDVHRRLTDLYGEKSLLALPLLLREEPIGAVVIDDVRSARDWTESEVELATLIAQQVAVAVANARLFEDLRRSYGDLARAQEELVKRERLAALGELAAVVAHEVRNPLGVIFNSIVSLRTIQRESLHEVIEEAVQVARSEASTSSVDMRIELAPDLEPFGLDARMVRQALLNVVLNGLQAMPKGGTLTVRATAERRGGRAYARVDVIDTGLGIPSEVQSRMFQPFFTTKASGTGLGLAVVKRIVEAHRGEIRVESRPGAGTTFTLHLPAEDGLA
jgi:signal transduction histidine kinase